MTQPIVVSPRPDRKGCKTYQVTCPICLLPRNIIATSTYATNPGHCMRCAQRKRYAEERLRKALTSLPPVDSRPLWQRALKARQ